LIVLAQAAGKSGSNPLAGLIPFVLLAAAMYYFVLRPQRARARTVNAAQSALEPGREVVLTSGIYGTVLHVDQDKIGLEIAPGVSVLVARAAVARVIAVAADGSEPTDPEASVS
jgi:preprotein translocase subunit YajC